MRISRHKASTDTVSATFAMTFAGSDADEAITATLQYSVLEPFAVRATFAMADAPGVEWVLARDLLREGLALPSGLGDIKIYPGDFGLLIELHSPAGRAVLHGPIAPVVDFVNRVYQTVPDGREGEYFSVDAELDLLSDLYVQRDKGLDA